MKISPALIAAAELKMGKNIVPKLSEDVKAKKGIVEFPPKTPVQLSE